VALPFCSANRQDSLHAQDKQPLISLYNMRIRLTPSMSSKLLAQALCGAPCGLDLCLLLNQKLANQGVYFRVVSTPQKLPSAGTAYGAGEPKVGEISGVTFIAS
jgi:hypothetical protein